MVYQLFDEIFPTSTKSRLTKREISRIYENYPQNLPDPDIIICPISFDRLQTFSILGSILPITFSTNWKTLTACSCSVCDRITLDWISSIGVPLNAVKKSWDLGYSSKSWMNAALTPKLDATTDDFLGVCFPGSLLDISTGDSPT